MSKKNKDIIIKPVKIDEKLFNKKEIYPWIYPSLHIILGHVASGKSTFLYNLINNYWKPVFKDNIILFSASARSDPILNKLIEDDKILFVFEDFNMSILNNVLDYIKNETDNDDPYLFVFDDILGKIAEHKLGKKGIDLDTLITTYRHQPKEGMISLVFTAQYHKHLSPTMRSNASYLYFLGCHSSKDKKSYAEEYSAFSNGNMSDFFKLYETAKNDKYNILCLNFRNLEAYRMGKSFKILYKDNQLLLDNDLNNDVDNDLDNDLDNLNNKLHNKINLLQKD